MNLSTSGAAAVATTSGASASHELLRGCFEIFRANAHGLAELSIETSNDLFEMDPLVTMEEIFEFKSKRKQWVAKFDSAMRDFFEKRLTGQRRKGRRPDPEDSLSSLRVLNDFDTAQQNALANAVKNLATAAKPEIDALDCRISALFDGSPGRAVDNPFSPEYLLDAVGSASRSLYPEARIWRALMERVVADFVPAIRKTYIQMNRFLAERGVLPEIGAMLRARSELRPADDDKLMPLFSRMINELHPSLQAWRTLDRSAAAAAGHRLASLAANPYAVDAANGRCNAQVAGDFEVGAFPRIDAVMAGDDLAPVLEMLDDWQRSDPLTEHLRSNEAIGIDFGVTPVARIPWIQAAIGSWVKEEPGRSTIDVIAFLFDYIFRDATIPPCIRLVFDGLQVPILKAALADPTFIAGKAHPARRLIDELASASVGADDDEAYGKAVEKLTTSIAEYVRAEFRKDVKVFENARRTLKKFTDERKEQAAEVIRPHVEAALAAEARETDRSQVRALIRDKLAGVETPFDVRAFIGAVWGEYLTLIRQTEGSGSDTYAAAVQTMDDMLWSIAVKERTGQKARLSKMIPPLVRNLRNGAAVAQVSGEKMKRFLDTLYELHIEALRPREGEVDGPSTGEGAARHRGVEGKQIENVHDFAADIVLGTWLAFEEGGSRVDAQLTWISPLRTTYIFTGRTLSAHKVFTPEELAWEVSAGKATLVLEPVPVVERALSAALDYLAAQKAKSGAEA